MSTKIATLYAEIGADTTKLQSGLAQSKTALQNFKGGLNETVQQLTGFNLAQISAAGAVVMGVQEVAKAVKEYSDYAESIDKLTMSTGMSADELSRLVQVADDFRVSQGELEGALKMALQNGFNPTTDALAKLADEINAISDPTEKAARLQGIFGRQWQNVIPLLERGGDAIREASAGIADGLIVTQKSIEENRAYQKAVDDLGDAWTATKNKLARDVIPVLTDVLGYLNKNAEAADKSATALEEGYGKIPGLAGGIGTLAAAQKKAAEAADKHAEALDKMSPVTKQAGKDQQDLIPVMQEVTFEANAQSVAFALAQGAAQGAGAGAHEMAYAALDLANAEDALKGATDNLAASQANWKENVGNDIASQLEQAGLKGQDYYDALKAIDDVQGTSTENAAKQKDATKNLVDEYIRTKDVDAFKKGLEDLDSAFMPLNKSVEESTKLVADLQEKVNELTGRAYWVLIHSRIDGPLAGDSTGGYDTGGGTGSPIGPNDNTHNTGKGKGQIGAAYGADFVVPAGYGEMPGQRPFTVNTSAGEHVTVTPNGQQAGNTYNLTVMTMQSPAAVQRGFQTMQILAGA